MDKTIKEKAKEYYKNLLQMPANNIDLANFAELILNEFIEELEANAVSIVCNRTLNSVILRDKSIDKKKSLNQLKKEFTSVDHNAKN